MYLSFMLVSHNYILTLAKVRALKQLHSQKTKSLMQTIQKLEKEMKTMKAANREHRRTQQIKKLMVQVKEAELVTDELKRFCMERNCFDTDRVCD